MSLSCEFLFGEIYKHEWCTGSSTHRVNTVLRGRCSAAGERLASLGQLVHRLKEATGRASPVSFATVSAERPCSAAKQALFLHPLCRTILRNFDLPVLRTAHSSEKDEPAGT